jgi:hypothetical protein
VVTPTSSLLCPCGAPAPAVLAPRGGRPVACPNCRTPLVAPDAPPWAVFERALGAALIAAIGAAAGWAALCYATRTGVPWSVAAAGALAGAAARIAARTRGGRVQAAAAIGLLVFLALGEYLVYRHALLPRLEAMHEAEGARDAAVRAQDELAQIQEDPERYAALEASCEMFLATALGIAAALWITRAPRAVVAFRAPVPPESAAQARRDTPADAAPDAPPDDAATACPSSSPPCESASPPPPEPPSPPASPGSPGSAPDAPQPPDGT